MKTEPTLIGLGAMSCDYLSIAREAIRNHQKIIVFSSGDTFPSPTLLEDIKFTSFHEELEEIEMRSPDPIERYQEPRNRHERRVEARKNRRCR